MNAIKMAAIDLGVVGLAAVGAYGVCRFSKYRRRDREKVEKIHETEVAISCVAWLIDLKE